MAERVKKAVFCQAYPGALATYDQMDADETEALMTIWEEQQKLRRETIEKGAKRGRHQAR
jgi:hypothetical protein